MGVSVVVRNNRPGGTAIDTFYFDNVFNPAISGTVPLTFALVPDSLPASVFTINDVPDTLFMQVTAWAVDAADPNRNCGATVDPDGSGNSLECTSNTPPIFATGLQGGFVERLIVSGQTVGFPQGALIADAQVDYVHAPGFHHVALAVQFREKIRRQFFDSPGQFVFNHLKIISSIIYFG